MSTSAGTLAFVDDVTSDATDIGVSPTKLLGVSEALNGVCNDVPLRPFRLPGVMTCCSRRLALVIHAESLDSRASKYSCWVSVSRRPGKKSRATISDIASVYVSSSITFLGRLIRFGGGGIKPESVERRTTALELEDSIAMSLPDLICARPIEQACVGVISTCMSTDRRTAWIHISGISRAS